TVAYVSGCRGIQIHSTPVYSGPPTDPTGMNQYDISIHDNLIHDTQCDGIVLATVDPSKGKVEVYNNIIYSAGKGPLPPDQGGNFACVYVSGDTNNGTPGSGTVEVYNNTMYDCGGLKRAGEDGAVENGGWNPNIVIRMRNNIVYQLPGEDYITSWGMTDYSN